MLHRGVSSGRALVAAKRRGYGPRGSQQQGTGAGKQRPDNEQSQNKHTGEQVAVTHTPACALQRSYWRHARTGDHLRPRCSCAEPYETSTNCIDHLYTHTRRATATTPRPPSRRRCCHAPRRAPFRATCTMNSAGMTRD